MTEVEAVSAEVTRWKLMGLGALGVTGWQRRRSPRLVTPCWSIWRVLRGG
ncbi:DUF1515 domain-containing protein [Mesorhizobium sp. M1060]|nr:MULTISPECIES: DUF1515 family protein [unclassified Mesorhizobium]WJI44871.1 DUF1515 domain-containing protein [Mesorhizobium sp. C120A]